MLAEKYQVEIDAILAKFPPEQKQAAVLSLLYLAQEEDGYIRRESIDEVAELLDMSSTQVGGLIGFYTLLHDELQGKFRLQICTDLPCALRGGEELSKQVCSNLRVQPGGTTEDGLITVEEVMCIAGCDKAPVLQLQTPQGIHYYEQQTVESVMDLVKELRARGGDG